MMIDRDSFEEWQAHPITEALMRALQEAEERLKQQWLEISLGSGRCEPIELAQVRERLRVYQELRELTPEKIEELLE